MIRWRDLLLLVAITTVLVGCGETRSANVTTSSTLTIPTTALTNSDWPSVYSDAAALAGRRVDLRGRVYSDPIFNKEGMVFSAWVDFDNDQLSTTFRVAGVTAGIEKDDFVWVLGRVVDVPVLAGANGDDPLVEVEQLTVTDRVGVRPAERILNVRQALEHNGVRVMLERVEFSDEEVRIYVAVENRGQEVLRAFGTGLRIELGDAHISAVIPVGKGVSPPRGLVEPGVTESGGFQFPTFDPKDGSFVVRWTNLGFESDRESPERWVWLVDPSGTIRPEG